MNTEREKSENRNMAGVILTLAWPTMLEQLMQTAVQYIDTAMVGSLGTSATAAVGATTTVNWLVNITISALSVGFLSYIARSLGAGDRDRAGRISGQAAMITIAVGVIFTVLTLGLSSRIPAWMQVAPELQKTASRYFFILYLPMLFRTANIIFGTVLRAAGDTSTPMKIGILVNIVNVILNTLLIYPTRPVFGGRMIMPGAGMGVEGAATASAAAIALGGILITVVLWRHPDVSPRGQKLTPDMAILKPCFKVSFPNMLQRFGTALGYVAFASMINALGETATAAHTIANTVESLFYIPGFGMQTAAATLSGNAYGADDPPRMKRLGKMFLPIEVSLMVISGGLLFAFAPYLIRIFSRSPEVIALASRVLRLVALSEPFFGVSIIVEGLMQGVGKTKEPFVFNILGMWAIRIGGTFICTHMMGYGLLSAWACMVGHNMFLFVMFLIYYLTGRWNPFHEKRV